MAANLASQTITYDNTAPNAGVLRFSQEEKTNTTGIATSSGSFNLNVVGQEQGSTVQIQISEDKGTSWTNTTSEQALSNGNYRFRAHIIDPAGNRSTTEILPIIVGDSATGIELKEIAETSSNIFDGSSLTLITGTTDELIEVVNNNNITKAENVNLNVTSGTTGVLEANQLANSSSGIVTATISEETLDALEGLNDSETNNYTIRVSETIAAASLLNELDDKTTIEIDTSQVSTITGSANAVKVAITSGGITLGILTGVTLETDSADASDLNIILNQTNAVVNGNALNTITGSAAEVRGAITSPNLTFNPEIAVVLNEGVDDANDLNAIDAFTSTVDATSVTSLTGSVANAITALESNGIISLGGKNVTIADLDVTATDLNRLGSKTLGLIDAKNLLNISGTALDIAAAYNSINIVNLNFTNIILDNETIGADDLNALAAKTNGYVDASRLTSLTGNIGTLITIYGTEKIIGLGAEAITLIDTTSDAGELRQLANYTSGTISADTVKQISGFSDDIEYVFKSSTITGISGDGGLEVNSNDNPGYYGSRVDLKDFSSVTGMASVQLTGDEGSNIVQLSAALTGSKLVTAGFGGSDASMDSLIFNMGPNMIYTSFDSNGNYNGGEQSFKFNYITGYNLSSGVDGVRDKLGIFYGSTSLVTKSIEVADNTTALALRLDDGKLYEDALAGRQQAWQMADVGYIKSAVASLIEFGTGGGNSLATPGAGRGNVIDFIYVAYGESSRDATSTSAYIYGGYYDAASIARNSSIDESKLNIVSLAEIVGVEVGDLNTNLMSGIIQSKAGLGLS